MKHRLEHSKIFKKILIPGLDNEHCFHSSAPRFLRHVPVVYVDYPGPFSLSQIYGTFNRAMLRLIPSLRTYAEPLTNAMVEFYTMSQVEILAAVFAKLFSTSGFVGSGLECFFLYRVYFKNKLNSYTSKCFLSKKC